MQRSTTRDARLRAATMRQRLSAALLLAWLAGCGSSAPVAPGAETTAPESGPVASVAYRADFASAEQIGSWAVSDVGTWALDDGRLLMGGGERFFMSMAPTIRFAGDLDLSVATRWIRGSVTGGYGLQWRVRVGADNYIRGYGFIIAAAGSYAVLRWDGDRDGNPPVFLAGWTESAAIRPFGTNVLRVSVSGDAHRLFVNGTQVATISDDRHAEGRIGLIVEDEQQVAFDDLAADGSARGDARQ